MNADKDSPLGKAINSAVARATAGKPDEPRLVHHMLHQPRVDFIEKVLDARDDAYEDVMVQLPPEFHEPVHKAITAAVVKTLGALDEGYVLLPNPDPDDAFNLAGDLAVIFSTIYDDVNT
ncbi:hypothetical protein D3C87_1217780 [compost metagenome]|jgi:hypothetical protein